MYFIHCTYMYLIQIHHSDNLMSHSKELLPLSNRLSCARDDGPALFSSQILWFACQYFPSVNSAQQRALDLKRIYAAALYFDRPLKQCRG